MKAENENEEKILKRTAALEKTIKEICGSESNVTSSVEASGSNSTSDTVEKHYVHVEVNEKIAKIDVESLQIHCTDQLLQHLLLSVTQKISHCLLPI